MYAIYTLDKNIKKIFELTQLNALTCGVLVCVHLSGGCPQLSLHMISGVGIPMAVQLITKVKEASVVTVGGGEVTMMGGA